MCFGVSLIEFNYLSPLGLIDLDVHVFSQVWKFFSHYCLKCTFSPFLFFWNSIKQIFFSLCLIIAIGNFFILFHSFSFCTSVRVISNVLSSKWLILSSVWLSVFCNFLNSSIQLLHFSTLEFLSVSMCVLMVAISLSNFLFMHCFPNFV